MARIVKCPKCGYEFDLSFGRVFACGSCPSRTLGDCGYIKCPECGFEFPSQKMNYF